VCGPLFPALSRRARMFFFVFFFSYSSAPERSTLSLHDALPIFFVATLGTTGTVVGCSRFFREKNPRVRIVSVEPTPENEQQGIRSEEHTSELQSLAYLVCRLLLGKQNDWKALALAGQRHASRAA